jgi:tetratricopeptide (TPR) repeat protein
VKSDYNTAAAHYRQVMAERPILIPAYYRLGRAFVGQQLHSEALDAFEELLKLDLVNLLAHYEIGKLNLSTRSHPDEESLYGPVCGAPDWVYGSRPGPHTQVCRYHACN